MLLQRHAGPHSCSRWLAPRCIRTQSVWADFQSIFCTVIVTAQLSDRRLHIRVHEDGLRGWAPLLELYIRGFSGVWRWGVVCICRHATHQGGATRHRLLAQIRELCTTCCFGLAFCVIHRRNPILKCLTSLFPLCVRCLPACAEAICKMCKERHDVSSVLYMYMFMCRTATSQHGQSRTGWTMS